LINLEGKKDIEIIKLENEIIIPEVKAFNWNEVITKIN
jgi:hypothetical protein